MIVTTAGHSSHHARGDGHDRAHPRHDGDDAHDHAHPRHDGDARGQCSSSSW